MKMSGSSSMVEGTEAFSRLRTAMKTILRARKSVSPKKQSHKEKSVRNRASVSRAPGARLPS